MELSIVFLIWILNLGDKWNDCFIKTLLIRDQLLLLLAIKTFQSVKKSSGLFY